MDLVQASLLLYLLFPVISDRQVQYSSYLRYNADPKEIQRKAELESFLSENEFFLEITEEEDDGTEEELIDEAYMKNFSGKLAFFKREDEYFSVSDKQKDFVYSSATDGDKIMRTKYDVQFRPLERLVWKNTSKIADAAITAKTSWSYEGDDVFMVDEDYAAKKVTETRANHKNLPVEQRDYELLANPQSTEETPLDDIKFLVKETFTTYDGENRVLSCEELFYDKTDPLSSPPAYFTQKQVFSYTDKSSQADTELYENGVLRYRVEYSDEDSYTATTYFEDGFFIQEVFQDDDGSEDNEDGDEAD